MKRDALLRGRPPRFLILKSRRCGVTTQEQAYSYAMCATRSGQQAVTLADTREKTKRIFRMVELFYERSPPAVRPHRRAQNRQELDFDRLGSTFLVGTAGVTSFGRGDTLHRVHGSEVAYWLEDRDQDLVGNLVAGLTEACSHGEVILESSANGQRGWFYEAVMAALRRDGEWTLIFVPWFVDPDCWDPMSDEGERDRIMAGLSDRERWLVEEHGVVAEQVKWRRRKSDERALRGRRFLQEYPETVEEAFVASSQMYFDAEVLNRIAREDLRDPTVENGWAYWAEPEDGHRYVLAMDPAEGAVGSDNSAAVLLDVETGEVVGRFAARVRPEELARTCVATARRFNGALIACERENHGHLALHVLANELHYPRLFRTKSVNERRRATLKLGWSTNPLTRPLMLDDMRNAFAEGALTVRDRMILNECRTFENCGRNERPEARAGFFDDLVMATAIAWTVRAKGLHQVRVTVL